MVFSWRAIAALPCDGHDCRAALFRRRVVCAVTPFHL